MTCPFFYALNPPSSPPLSFFVLFCLHAFSYSSLWSVLKQVDSDHTVTPNCTAATAILILLGQLSDTIICFTSCLSVLACSLCFGLSFVSFSLFYPDMICVRVSLSPFWFWAYALVRCTALSPSVTCVLCPLRIFSATTLNSTLVFVHDCMCSLALFFNELECCSACLCFVIGLSLPWVIAGDCADEGGVLGCCVIRVAPRSIWPLKRGTDLWRHNSSMPRQIQI